MTRTYLPSVDDIGTAWRRGALSIARGYAAVHHAHHMERQTEALETIAHAMVSFLIDRRQEKPAEGEPEPAYHEADCAHRHCLEPQTCPITGCRHVAKA